MVWFLPVPGGLWITRLWSAMTAEIARCWLESASRTRNSLSGGIRSNSFGSGSRCSALTSLLALLSLAIAAIKSWTGSSFARRWRSAGQGAEDEQVQRALRKINGSRWHRVSLIASTRSYTSCCRRAGEGDGDRNATASNFDRLQNGLRNRTATSGG